MFISRSSPAHRSIVTYSLSSVVLFRAFLFVRVPFAPSVAQIPQRVVAFLNSEIHQQVVRVLDSLFLHRLVQFFLLAPEDEYHTPAIAISISFRLISSSEGGLLMM